MAALLTGMVNFSCCGDLAALVVVVVEGTGAFWILKQMKFGQISARILGAQHLPRPHGGYGMATTS
jgi:hypothetical protein